RARCRPPRAWRPRPGRPAARPALRAGRPAPARQGRTQRMTLPELTGPDALIVGIDIGGTKTHLRAEPAGGGPARDLVLPSADWRRRDWDADAAALLGMVARLA